MRLESVNQGLMFSDASAFKRAAQGLLAVFCLGGLCAPSFAQSAMQFIALERCSDGQAVGAESAAKLDASQCVLLPP